MPRRFLIYEFLAALAGHMDPCGGVLIVALGDVLIIALHHISPSGVGGWRGSHRYPSRCVLGDAAHGKSRGVGGDTFKSKQLIPFG